MTHDEFAAPTSTQTLTCMYTSVGRKQTGYKEIGDNPEFIAACHCNHEADEESKIEASIATKHELSINEKFVGTIDNDHANEINDFLEGSITSWENDYYQPCFAVNTATPSKMKMSAMERDEYDDGYKEEATIEYSGFAMEETRVLRGSHDTRGETSIDGDITISIDTHHGTEADARAKDSASIGRRGQPSIDKCYKFGQRPTIPKEKDYSIGKRKMNVMYTETSMDLHEHQMEESFMCQEKTSIFWRELQCMRRLVFVYQSMQRNSPESCQV
uniref:Uncharacterized protein n=1 Tax=Brassica campestris TaxID=3711 RepID=M4ETS5_BRACM